MQGADQGSSFYRAEGTEVRTSMISPPNLYGNMNETRILKNGATRHSGRTKGYIGQPNGDSFDEFGNQVRDGAASDESLYFCVAYPTIRPTNPPGTMIWT
jgi:hypothetical protein